MTQPLGNCPGCGGDEPFEQVHAGPRAEDPCPDAEDCPEWLCLGCGAAVFMGTVFMGTAFMGTAVFAGVLAGPAEQQALVQAGQPARAA
jgi:hypothetical protein